ncbi:unnamed protein product, partial [Choristocarpus tenellus]
MANQRCQSNCYVRGAEFWWVMGLVHLFRADILFLVTSACVVLAANGAKSDKVGSNLTSEGFRELLGPGTARYRYGEAVRPEIVPVSFAQPLQTSQSYSTNILDAKVNLCALDQQA